MKIAIVAGCNGFIGKALVNELLANDYKVIGLARNACDDIKNEKFSYINTDILAFDPNMLEEEKNIDYFFNCVYSGVTGKAKKDYLAQSKNIKTACYAMECAIALGCKKYIYVGSVEEYGSILEIDKQYVVPTSNTVYGATKRYIETLCEAMAFWHNIEYGGALLTLTYGRGNFTKTIPNVLIENIKLGKVNNLIEGSNYYDCIYIDDATSAIRHIAEAGKNMTSYYVGHEELSTFRDIITRMAYSICDDPKLNFGGYKVDDVLFDYSVIHRSKLREDTGFVCKYSYEDGIRLTKEWIENSKVFEEQ